MQRVTLVRYAARPDRADENEALSRAVFTDLRANAPPGLVYSLFRDGLDFVHLFINVEDDAAEGLTELAAFKAYVADIASRCQAPPQVTRIDMNLLESYGLPTARA